MAEWTLGLGVIKGYPYPLGIDGVVPDYPFDFTDERFSFKWSGETLGWKLVPNVLSGYPHIKYRALAPPVMPPLLVSVELNRRVHVHGIDMDLEMDIQLRHAQVGDLVIVEVFDIDNHTAYREELYMPQPGHFNLSHIIKGSIISGWAVGKHDVSTTIMRDPYTHSGKISNEFLVMQKPEVEILSIIPNAVTLPISSANERVDIEYAINGEGIDSVNNTFTITDSHAISEVSSTEKLEIISTTPAPLGWNFNFNFTVTDPDFRLVSFRFRFNNTNQNTEVRYNLNGAQLLHVPWPPQSSGWVEWVAQSPVLLNIGANTIQITNDFGDLQLFSTSIRPSAPGLNITSGTVWAMEMVYTISTSGIVSGQSRTVMLSLGSGIGIGEHPLVVDTVIHMKDFPFPGGILSTQIIDKALTVNPSFSFPELIDIVLYYFGRYVGAEVDISVSLQMAEVFEGDELEIRLMKNDEVVYLYADKLSDNQTSHVHIIKASYFQGLPPGRYEIIACIIRGQYKTSAAATYDVIEIPLVSLVSISPSVIFLPDTSSIKTNWNIAMPADNIVDGTVGLMNTIYAGKIRTQSDMFIVEILDVPNLNTGLHTITYCFIVTHDVFGTVNINGTLRDRLFAMPPKRNSGVDTFDINAVFLNVECIESGFHSLNTDIIIVSEEYGNAQINQIDKEVFSVTSVPIEVSSISLDVPGRYPGSELPVTLTASGISHTQATDIFRVNVARNDVLFYSENDLMDAGLFAHAHEIPYHVFADIFKEHGYGECLIVVSIIRSSDVKFSGSLLYRIVEPPNMKVLNVSHKVVNLPLFYPINFITNFALNENADSHYIDCIKASIELNGQTGNNFSYCHERNISVAIMNVQDINSGIHNVYGTFEFDGLYGRAAVNQEFADVINVFPHVQTEGTYTQYAYDLILCMPNKTELQFIEVYDVVYNPMFLQYNQLNFSIYREIVTEDGTVYINPVWEKILSDMVVLMHIRVNEQIVYSEYFVIENPNMSYNGLDQMSFQAYSYEKIFLNNLDLSGWRDVVKRLYDPTNRTGDDGLPHGILNYILRMKWHNVWTLRHVDGSVLGRERVLSFSGNNMRFVIDTLEESFNCVFVFDNVNMILDIFERTIGMLGNNRGLVVADDTYATSIDYHEDTTGIKTRVFVFGKNQATMARYNPTGQLYVDDFSFYMNLQYMTQELIDALENYRNLVESQQGVWTGLVDRMNAGETSGELQEEIEALRSLLAWENNFTREQIRQIAPFIKEETVNINTIEDGQELYRFALRHIKTTAFVPIQITINSIDVLALEEHQKDWLKFRIGDFVNIYRKEFDLEYKEMRLISYEHNPIRNTLRLEFSNRDELVTQQWLNNMFFYRLGNLENNWNNERDWYIRVPEFDFNSPVLRDLVQNVVQIEVDNSIEVLVEEIDERTINHITEVFETQVLAADTAHILNAWVRYMKVDMLETNFEALDPRISWPVGTEPFVRYFIRISGVTMQHVVAELSPTEVENYMTPGFRMADGSWSQGNQIYWTAIGDHPQAFRFFTITDPVSVYPVRRVLTNPLPPGVAPPLGYKEIWRDLDDAEKEAIRERFRVKVRRTLRESVRKTDAFEYVRNPGGGETMIPKTIWGGGDREDQNTALGRGYQYKDWDGFNMTYTTRTGYGDTPAGAEIGIRIQDDGCYYFDVDKNEWLRIGSGGMDRDELRDALLEILNVNIDMIGMSILLPELPTQAQIDSFPVNSVVHVYDLTNPFVPER